MDGYQKYCDLIKKSKDLKNQIIEYNTKRKTAVRSGEKYFDEKLGLWCCSCCHTPIEAETGRTFSTFDGLIPEKISVDCECWKKYIDDSRQLEEVNKNLENIEFFQKQCFSDKSMKKLVLSKAQDNRKNMTMIRRYADHWETALENNIGLLLWGSVGTGKTYAAACLANELIFLYQTRVHMTNFATILNDLTGNVSERNEYIEKLCRCDLLIIDDLGMERNTSFATEQVYHVIDTRYQMQKPLVITTNLTLDFMKNPQNIEYARIYDRILEMCTPIHFEGKNLRAEKAKEKFKVIKSFMGDDEKENEK